MRKLIILYLATGTGFFSFFAAVSKGEIYAVRVNTVIGTEGHSPDTQLDLLVNDWMIASAEDWFEDMNTGREFNCYGYSDLEYAELEAAVSGTGGPTGNWSNSAETVNAMILETLMFEGDFTDYSLPVKASVEGQWFAGGAPIQYAQVRAQCWVVDASVPITEADLATVGAFNNLILDPCTPRLFADFPIKTLPSYSGNDPFNLYINGVVPLNGHNPTIKIIFGITFIVLSDQQAAEWNGYFLGSLNFDFGDLAVYSQSGCFPDTEKMPGPETVDMHMFFKISASWLADCPAPDWCGGADLNYDYIVSLPDLEIFSQKWLKLRPAEWLLRP